MGADSPLVGLEISVRVRGSGAIIRQFLTVGTLFSSKIRGITNPCSWVSVLMCMGELPLRFSKPKVIV